MLARGPTKCEQRACAGRGPRDVKKDTAGPYYAWFEIGTVCSLSRLAKQPLGHRSGGAVACCMQIPIMQL